MPSTTNTCWGGAQTSLASVYGRSSRGIYCLLRVKLFYNRSAIPVTTHKRINYDDVLVGGMGTHRSARVYFRYNF